MSIQDIINDYWTDRSDEFSSCRLKDLEGHQRIIWTDIIKEQVPDGKGLRALDIGTGGGFYAVLLADLGFDVTAIDYSEKMVQNAISNSHKLGYKTIHYLKMDAQHLEFDNETFDFIISRNVTWTLPDPKRAYEEWCRVLKPGGIIMNFDANYGQGFKFAEERGETYKQMQNWVPSTYNRALQSEELIRRRNEYTKQLYISNDVRPQWDVDVLLQNGISQITLDTEISNRVYTDVESTEGNNKDRSFGSDSKMFMVLAVKHSK